MWFKHLTLVFSKFWPILGCSFSTAKQFNASIKLSVLALGLEVFHTHASASQVLLFKGRGYVWNNVLPYCPHYFCTIQYCVYDFSVCSNRIPPRSALHFSISSAANFKWQLPRCWTSFFGYLFGLARAHTYSCKIGLKCWIKIIQR